MELTFTETQELQKLEALYASGEIYSSQELGVKELYEDFNFKTTTNTGIHNFCIDRMFNLVALASNETITLLTASLIFYKEKDKAGSVAKYVSYELLRNPVVYNNAELYNLIFDNASSVDYEETLLALLYSVEFIPVTVLLPMLLKVNTALQQDSFIKSHYLHNVYLRKVEIREWLNNKYPMPETTPFSWVLRSYGVQL